MEINTHLHTVVAFRFRVPCYGALDISYYPVVFCVMIYIEKVNFFLNLESIPTEPNILSRQRDKRSTLVGGQINKYSHADIIMRFTL